MWKWLLATCAVVALTGCAVRAATPPAADPTPPTSGERLAQPSDGLGRSVGLDVQHLDEDGEVRTVPASRLGR